MRFCLRGGGIRESDSFQGRLELEAGHASGQKYNDAHATTLEGDLL